MDWQAMLSGFLGGILAALLVMFLFPSDNCTSNDFSATILKIGNVPIASIPRTAEIVYKNSSVANKLKHLKEQGSAYIFQSCVRGSEIAQERHFQEAFEKTLIEISMFLNSSVKSVTLYEKYQNKEFFNKVSEVLSSSVTAGSQVIVKYKYIDGVLGYNFCVVTLYDPQEAFKARSIQERLKNISQKYGVNWENLVKELQDAMKENYGK